MGSKGAPLIIAVFASERLMTAKILVSLSFVLVMFVLAPDEFSFDSESPYIGMIG